MCGRFDRHSELKRFAGLVQGLTLETVPDMAPSYNIAPSRRVATIIVDTHGIRRFDVPVWGFVPAWSNKPGLSRPINARAESVANKPMFHGAFSRNRCLVPCDGYYEWRGQGAAKQPYYFTAADGGPLLIAALHEFNNNLQPGTSHTVCLVTREADGVLRDVHHRMPVLLAGDAAEVWLARETPVVELDSLMQSGGLVSLAFHPVDRFVNSPGNDSPRCIEAL